jgi:hypothetical protein
MLLLLDERDLQSDSHAVSKREVLFSAGSLLNFSQFGCRCESTCTSEKKETMVCLPQNSLPNGYRPRSGYTYVYPSSSVAPHSIPVVLWRFFHSAADFADSHREEEIL